MEIYNHIFRKSPNNANANIAVVISLQFCVANASN